MTVYRVSPLPRGRARTKLIVPATVTTATLEVLRTFRGTDGKPHEGLVYWAGRCVPDATVVCGALVPAAQHEPFRVVADERAVGRAARVARGWGLGLVAQVHSHPDDDTRHSEGDDRLILMPFEGMFSLVVAHYGLAAFSPGRNVGVHQFQDGVWVEVEPPLEDAITVVPSAADLRA